MTLPTQNYIKYGMILNGLILACLLFLYLTGQTDSFDKKGPFDVIMVLAPFVVLFLGIWAKKKSLKHKMSFKQGLIEGIKISLVFGSISPFIFLVYYLHFNRDILEYVRTAYGLTGASDQMVILVDMLAQLAGAVVVGTIFSAGVSFFLKSR